MANKINMYNTIDIYGYKDYAEKLITTKTQGDYNQEAIDNAQNININANKEVNDEQAAAIQENKDNITNILQIIEQGGVTPPASADTGHYDAGFWD